MAKVLRLKRRIQNVSDMHNKSADEQIADIFGQIMSEIQGMEDIKLRDSWMDAVNTFIMTGDTNSLEKVTRWRRPVVPLDEFLFGKTYLGQIEGEIYPGVIQGLHDIDTDAYDEIVEQGAIGIGKTTLANLGCARDIYKISCMRNPHQTYGIAQGTPIVLTIQSVRLSTAKKVVFEELGRYIRNSPYFMTRFRFDPLITSEMIFREHNLHVMPISSSGTAAISMNVLGGQMDEANFLAKVLKSKSSQADEQGSFDQAKQLYNALSSRRKSRFVDRGDLPGALYLISSSRFPDDFTAVKAAQAESKGGTDPRIYVFEGSQWSVKGRERFSDEEFRVQIGNETYPSKLLDEGQPGAPGCEIIEVPENFRDVFTNDVDLAIRDFAGRTTLSTAPFFSQRDKIAQANIIAKEHGYENPMSLEEVELSTGLPQLNKARVRTDVKAERVAHVDLGITQDACGLAVGHIAGYKVREYTNDDTGKTETEILPVIAYDVIVRIVQPLGGEIQLDDVRKFLRMLKTKYKIPIDVVTFDGFQSVDSKQLLAKQGFKTGHTSVEKIEPWRTFRDALYDGRVLLPTHQFLNKELAEVERTTKNNKEKVDHRPNGTKDVADGVVGVAAYLFRRRIAWGQIRGINKPGMYIAGDKTKPKNTDANVSNPPALTLPKIGGTLRRSITRRSVERR